MADFTPQQIEQFLQEFFDVVGTRQYTGARYVPIFGRAGEDTIVWDDLAPYEPLTVVMHEGVSYVSRRYVPRGIQITDTAYWLETYRFNAQVEAYRQEVLGFSDRIDGAYAAVDGLRVEVSDQYVPFPTETSKFGEVGQVLSTAGMGETEWVDPVIPDAEDVETAVDTWLTAHPEATTTVTDGSVTDAKLSADGIKNVRPEIHDILYSQLFYSVNGNLAQSSLFTVHGYFNPTGTWAQNANYTSAFVPIPGPGTYQTRKSSGSWGASQLNIQLANGSKGFARNIVATDAGNEVVQFTLTDDDVRNAAYVVLSYRHISEAMPMLFKGPYPSSQTFVEPIIQFADNLCLRKMGTNPSNINTLAVTGYWSDVSTSATGVPQGANIGSSGLLIIINKAFNRATNLQLLVEPNNPAKKPTIWMRLINTNGTEVYAWHRLGEELAYLPMLSNRTLPSLSGNVADSSIHEVVLGKYMDNLGNFVDNQNLAVVFVPIMEAGTYVRYVPTTYGTNTYLIVCDRDKNLISASPGTQLSDRWYSYDLTAMGTDKAYYAALNVTVAAPEPYFAMADSVPSYPAAQLQGANFDYSGEHLYRGVLVCDGDSICNAASDLPTLQGGWWGRTARALSMTGRNYGIGGGTITAELYYEGTTPRHWVSRNIDTIHTDYPTLDVLLLEGGTNDADLIGSILDPQSIPAAFGTWTADDFGGTYDDTTFCGAVESLFYKALNYYPTAKIGFIIPMEMGRSTNVANRRAYFDEIAKIAEKWHIPVLDLWNTSHMDARLTVFYDSSLTNAQNIAAGKAYQDGQHPTNVGYDLLQRQIATFVKGL